MANDGSGPIRQSIFSPPQSLLCRCWRTKIVGFAGLAIMALLAVVDAATVRKGPSVSSATYAAGKWAIYAVAGLAGVVSLTSLRAGTIRVKSGILIYRSYVTTQRWRKEDIADVGLARKPSSLRNWTKLCLHLQDGSTVWLTTFSYPPSPALTSKDSWEDEMATADTIVSSLQAWLAG